MGFTNWIQPAKVAGRGPMEVWHENWDAFLLFRACHRQWRVGPNGQPYALDYGAVGAAMDALRLRGRKRKAVFAQLMEAEDRALEIIGRKANSSGS